MRESKIKGKVYHYDKQTGKMVTLSPGAAEVLPAGNAQSPDLDRVRVQAMAEAMMLVIRDNFLQGPNSRERVYEALNALAMTVGLVIHGTDDPEALEWFSEALNTNLKP